MTAQLVAFAIPRSAVPRHAARVAVIDRCVTDAGMVPASFGWRVACLEDADGGIRRRVDIAATRDR